MNMKKTSLSAAIGLAIGGLSLSADAALTASATLSFTDGAPATVSCLLGTTPPCTNTLFNQTDIAGSYFTMDTDGSGTVEVGEKNPIAMFAPIHIGSTALSSGQHTGVPDGSESPAIDKPWNFFGNTGMHNLSSPISVISDFGSTKTLDFSGWGVNWGNFGPGGVDGPTIPMGGTATIVCSTSSCSAGSTYVLDMAVHVPQAFTSVPYTLHLEGTVGAVPVPAAAWLFGSGVVGLAGVARRRRNKKG